MFPKQLLRKTVSQQSIQHGSLTVPDLNIRIILHHGIPLTSSILAYDPIQGLLAIGTLDGRIKIIRGDGIECLLVSPIKLPFKSLEFFHNMGYLVSVSNENDIQVWDLEHRCVAYYMQWESNVTSFSVIQGSSFMYVGDEAGIVSVLEYNAEEEIIVKMPYNVSITSIAGITLPTTPTVVGILPHPSSVNRVLIAYENGLIILWDTREDKEVFFRNSTDIQLKNGEGSNSLIAAGDNDICFSETEQEEKEICSLCWASADGSILAVGYIDGDILLWNISSLTTRKGQEQVLSADVAKLQLSSAERRLPVIVLHWRACGNVNRSHGGQLFIYGGDDIGSEEVLTVLSLEWSSGLDSLRCISRTALKLHGSFADMILLPALGSVDKCSNSSLFVLTNPGQLHTYDESSLSMLSCSKEGAPSICEQPFPGLIPLVDPSISVAKIFSLPKGERLSEMLAKVALNRRTKQSSHQKSVSKWPLTGGVPNPLSFDGTSGVERVFIMGYQDGSVQVWDATFPSLSFIFDIEKEMHDVKVSDPTAPVSALALCCTSGTLAIGSQSGLIRVYNLLGSSHDINCHFVSETTDEVHLMKSEKEYQCVAMFSLLKSPIHALQILCSGTQLAIGCEDGQVLMLNLQTFIVMFHRDHVGSINAAVVSMAMECLYPISSAVDNPKHPIYKPSEQDMAEGLNCFFLADKDAHIIAVNAATGDMISSQPLHPKDNSTAISMHILVQGKSTKQSPVEDIGTDEQKHILVAKEGTSCDPKIISDYLLLLCCEKALRVYSLESVLEGESKWIHKVDLEKPCCWTATFRKDENTIGVVLLYQTGLLEIRSFPGLELIAGSSLLSILRWNLNANMAKTVCDDGNGHIVLNNSSELAIISILSGENDFRIPDSLACLHDKVLAAAADAAMSMASSQVKKQDPSPGIFGNIMKGFKSGPVRNTIDNSKGLSRAAFAEELRNIFSNNPFHDSSKGVMCEQDVVELSIDDIEIDDILPTSTSSTASRTLGSTSKPNKTDEEIERQKLLGGRAGAEKPRMRRPEEIIAQYRKAGDASGAAKQARDKLVERQEKLERLDRRTAELESGAQNFKSMADELVKRLERRKWWQI